MAQESVVSQSERREERIMNMYKSMRIGAMHNVQYNEEAVHATDRPSLDAPSPTHAGYNCANGLFEFAFSTG